MWFCGSACVCNLLSILVCIIKKLWHGSSDWLLHPWQVPVKTKPVPWTTEARPRFLCIVCLLLMPTIYLIYLFVLWLLLFLWWPTPFFPNHKTISPNDLLGHLIPLCSEEPLCEYLAICNSCQLHMDEKGRKGLITGFLLIALHLTYFSLATGDYKKKLFYLKCLGVYVISTVNRSHPGRGANDHGPHWQFDPIGWFFSNEFTSCIWHIRVTSLRLTK